MTEAEEAFGVLARWPRCYHCREFVTFQWIPGAINTAVHPTCYLVVSNNRGVWDYEALEAAINLTDGVLDD